MDGPDKQIVQDIRVQEWGGTSWIDVESPNEEVFKKLENDYHLHPVHLNESIQKVQHTQVEREDQYLFFVLHTPVYDKRADKILVNQVGVFLGRNFLITIRTGANPIISELFELCEQKPEQKEECFKRGSGYLLYVLISQHLNSISDMAESVISELDAIEDIVFDNTGSDAQRIGRVRQKIVKLGALVGPKKFILEDLSQQIDSFTEQNLSKYYSNNTKTVVRLREVIEEAKETIEIYKDADFTTSTEQTNKTLAILTLVFTFSIPTTVVGALYGMNVLLPGGIETGSWRFLGTYTTLILVLAVSIGAAVAMYVYFKQKKWF